MPLVQNGLVIFLRLFIIQHIKQLLHQLYWNYSRKHSTNKAVSLFRSYNNNLLRQQQKNLASLPDPLKPSQNNKQGRKDEKLSL